MELIDFERYIGDFTWDYKLHFPVPTLNYITQRTGEDLLKLFNTELEANGKTISLTRSAKQFLFKNRVDEKAWEYEIAHNIDLLYEVLEYILEFINFAFITGDYIDYYKLSNSSVKSLGLTSTKNNLLGARKLMPIGIILRSGY